MVGLARGLGRDGSARLRHEVAEGACGEAQLRSSRVPRKPTRTTSKSGVCKGGVHMAEKARTVKDLKKLRGELTERRLRTA